MFGQTEQLNLEAVRSEGLLPTLQNIVSGVLKEVPTVLSSFLQYKQTKEQVEAQEKLAKEQLALLEAQRAAMVAQAQVSATTTRYPTYGAQIFPGFDLKQNWPILGIIGIGIFLALRGRGKKESLRIVRSKRAKRR